jgi:hypothetical protein
MGPTHGVMQKDKLLCSILFYIEVSEKDDSVSEATRECHIPYSSPLFLLLLRHM